jgi:hypothetical protein
MVVDAAAGQVGPKNFFRRNEYADSASEIGTTVVDFPRVLRAQYASALGLTELALVFRPQMKPDLTCQQA